MNEKKYQLIKTVDYLNPHHEHIAIFEFDDFPEIEDIRHSISPERFTPIEALNIRRGAFISRGNTSYKLRRWGLPLNNGILSK